MHLPSTLLMKPTRARAASAAPTFGAIVRPCLKPASPLAASNGMRYWRGERDGREPTKAHYGPFAVPIKEGEPAAAHGCALAVND